MSDIAAELHPNDYPEGHKLGWYARCAYWNGIVGDGLRSISISCVLLLIMGSVLPGHMSRYQYCLSWWSGSHCVGSIRWCVWSVRPSGPLRLPHLKCLLLLLLKVPEGLKRNSTWNAVPEGLLVREVQEVYAVS